MKMRLLIVESPTKARKIQQILGTDGFKVIACCGHIRDLDKKTLSIEISNDFNPIFVNIPNKIQEIKRCAREANEIWIGSDNDVEGEAIAWHLASVLGVLTTHKRITFNEITKPAIIHAVNNPRVINNDLVQAQIARRIIDRLVGFKLSPILWNNVADKNVSAGRVQSAALKLICDREQRVKLNPNQTCHWKVAADFKIGDGDTKFSANLVNVKLDSIEDTEKLLRSIPLQTSKTNSSVSKTKTKPYKPFTTSTLQQEAGEKLGMSPQSTMKAAQSLYEQGFITYMRTDSCVISDDAHNDIRDTVFSMYGESKYEQRVYPGKKGAHEAIRPTYASARTINVEHAELYDLIWKRTISSQMIDAVTHELVIDAVMSPDHIFKGKIRTLVDAGWMVVYDKVAEEVKHERIESVSLCDTIVATNVWKDPPTRYSESVFVKTMETEGIGRPSTYAAIVDKLYSKHYIEKKNIKGESVTATDIVFNVKTQKMKNKTRKHSIGSEKSRIIPTDIGLRVNEFLAKNFDYIVDTNFTAELELDLDNISSGKTTRKNVLDDFWSKFSGYIEKWTHVSEWDIKTFKYGPVLCLDKKMIGLDPVIRELGISINEITKEHVDVLKMFPIKKKNNVTICIGPYGVYLKKANKNVAIPKTIYSKYGIMDIHKMTDLEVSNSLCLHFL